MDAFPQYGFNGFLPPLPEDSNTPAEESDLYFDRITQGAGNVVRFPLLWCERVVGLTKEQATTDPGPASWNWSGVDHVMNEIKERNEDSDPSNNLRVIPMLLASPQWATGAGGSACAPHSAPPNLDHLGAWRQFVGEVLDKYGPPHDDPDTEQVEEVGDTDYGLIAVEAWNEPNVANFWGSPPQNAEHWNGENAQLFAALVNTAYEAVQGRGLETAVKLLPGGLSPDGATPSTKKFATDAYSHINPSAVGALSIHLYANNAGSDKLAARKIDEDFGHLLDGIRESPGENFMDLPRWITEIGFPSARIVPRQAGKGSSEATQRRRLVDAFYRFAFKQRVSTFLVHTHHEWTNFPGSEANNFGVWRAVPYGVVQCADDRTTTTMRLHLSRSWISRIPTARV